MFCDKPYDSVTFSKLKTIIKVAKSDLISEMDGAEKKKLEDEILLLIQTLPQVPSQSSMNLSLLYLES